MNSHQIEVYDSLKSMGFEQQLIEKAWNQSDIKTIEGLINWIDAHPQQINLAQPSQVVQDQTQQKESTQNQQQKQNKNVDKLVKKEIVNILESKGYSTLVSEKATLMSGNKTEQEALQWIEQHKDDQDFEDPIEVETKPQLTKEEARRQAKELQAKIRKEAEEIEKQKALDAEKRRIQMGKELSHAQRIMKEQQEKIAIKEFVKNKKKLENDKEEMLRKLEQDKIERFGKDYVAKQQQVVDKTKIEEFLDLYDKMYKIYRMGQIKELQTCLKTLTIYIGNILKNPNEKKYQKINSNNSNFKKRVGDIIGSQKILELAGFKLNNDGFFQLENMDQKLMNDLHQEISKKVQKLSQM